MTDHIKSIAEPVVTNRLEDCVPLSGASDLAFVRETTALCLRSTGNRASLVWPWHYRHENDQAEGTYKYYAPVARLTAANTWTDFKHGATGASFTVPWNIGKARDGLRMYCACVTAASDLQFSMRLSKETLTTSTATQTSIGSLPVFPTTQLTADGWAIEKWTVGTPSMFVTQIQTHGLSIPSDRLVLLRPQISLVQSGPAAFGNRARVPAVWLYWMMAHDTSTTEVTGG